MGNGMDNGEETQLDNLAAPSLVIKLGSKFIMAHFHGQTSQLKDPILLFPPPFKFILDMNYLGHQTWSGPNCGNTKTYLLPCF